MARWLMVVALVVAACGDDDDGGAADAAIATPDGPAMPDGPEAADAAPPVMPDASPGAPHHYVMDTMNVPDTSAESSMLAQDIDGDPMARPDNLLGNILATLAAQDIDIQTTVDESIFTGDLIELFSLRAEDLMTDDLAEWQVWLGDPVAMPDFGGAGMFTISADSPTDAVIPGAIAAGRFVGGPGTAPLGLALATGEPVIVLQLIGARLDVAVTETSCGGRLGGGVTQEEVDTVFVPALASMLTSQVAKDPGCPAACSPQTLTILDLFDTDGDFVVTADELRANDLIQSLLAPDVDLLDADGNFNPRVDGIAESLSIGVGITCVGAVFTAPGE